MTATSGLQVGQGAEDFFQLDFGLQLQLARLDIQAARTQRDLGAGFLAADIQHLLQMRDVGQRLQQQGRLADTRIAADQHHAARHQAAAQHAVEFLDAGAEARHVDRLDVGQRQHRRRLRQALVLRLGQAVQARRLDHVSTIVFHCWQEAHCPVHLLLPCRRTRCRCNWFLP
jgi:hypothetical protein